MRQNRQKVEAYLDGLVADLTCFASIGEFYKLDKAITFFDNEGYNMREYKSIRDELKRDLPDLGFVE